MDPILYLLMAAGLSGLITALSLPYNPSSILLSPKYPNTTYAFLSTVSTSLQGQLVSIDISSTLQSSDLPMKTVSANLPFLQEGGAADIAYTTFLSESETISVYTGSCSSNSSLWVFNPEDSSNQSTDGGTWTEASTTKSPAASAVLLSNANFLASAFSFPISAEPQGTQSSVYIFGGMCPTSRAPNATTWQNAASYSNNMLKLSQDSGPYQISVVNSAGGSPIAEAGFTITALGPTYSNSSSGIVTQAQNFLLLGGHTQMAFINMSQVALFSLPEESWSFQTVSSASSTESTELAARSESSALSTPDSRSGHTTILNSDSTALIVFGGWVGDINTAAEPQLAILHLGEGFGGTGEWAWEMPSASGAGLSSGEGIYGHGAIMLPGNVMMVVGGYSIASPGSRKLKRSIAASQALFLNTTTMSWIPDYTNPSYITNASSNSTNLSQTDSSNSQKVVLGVSLGLGLAAVIGAAIFYYCYSRKLKRRKEARERNIKALSQGAHEFYMNNNYMTEQAKNPLWGGIRGGEKSREGRTPWSSSASAPETAQDTTHGTAAYVPYNRYGDNSHSSGQIFLQSSGESRGTPAIPRKPINNRNAKGHYQLTPNALPHSNGLRTAGIIHPIYEADEDIDISGNQNTGSNLKSDDDTAPPPCEPSQDAHTFRSPQNQNSDRMSDPFSDPATLVHYDSSLAGPANRPETGYEQNIGRSTPSPVNYAKSRERGIKEWVADWASAGAILRPHSRTQSITNSGRGSPTKESISGSGRTESNLSERSIATARSLGLSRNSSGRNNSLTAFFVGSGGSRNHLVPSNSTVVGLGTVTNQGHGDASPLSEQFGGNIRGLQPPRSADSGTASFNTAYTTQSGPAPHVEAEGLLSQHSEAQGSPSKNKAMKLSRRQENWLGSLKRVFASTEKGRPDSYGSSSAQSSPSREYNYGSNVASSSAAGAEPRRAASAASTNALMWRRKQGRGDWEDSADQIQRSNTFTTDSSGRPLSYDLHGLSEAENADDEEDWDIERAVERRVVQVMFTVPREKLRVVNHDISVDEASEAGSLHGGDTSGESVRGEGRQESSVTRKGKGKVKSLVEEIEMGKSV